MSAKRRRIEVLWQSSEIQYKVGTSEDRMHEILYAKFFQNKDIRYELLNTGNVYLIEGIIDDWWGAGC